MATPRESKNGNLNHLPALRSVPAKRLTEKEKKLLTKDNEKTVPEKGNATKNLDKNNSNNSIEYEINLPVLPPLPCTLTPDLSKTETIHLSTEKMRQKAEEKNNDPSKLGLINLKRSENKILKLPKAPPLRPVPVKPVLKKNVNRQLGRRVKTHVKKVQRTEIEKPNVPERPTLRSTASIWGLNGQRRNSLTKRIPQTNVRKGTSLPLSPNMSVPGYSTDGNQERTDASSISAPQRTPAKRGDSTSKNVKQKTARKRSNSKRRLPNPQESNEEIVKSDEPFADTPSPVLKKRKGRPRASASKRNEQKTVVDIDPSMRTPKAKSKGLKQGKRSQQRLSAARSTPIAKQPRRKDRVSHTKKVARRLFGSGNLPLKAETNASDSREDLKRPIVRSTPESERLSKKANSNVDTVDTVGINKRPEKIIVGRDSNHPKSLPLPIPVSLDSRGYHAGKSSTKKVISSPKMVSKRKRPANGSRDNAGKASGKVVKKIAKPRRKKISPVTNTMKNGQRSSSVPNAESQMRKESNTKETTQAKIGTSKFHTTYLPSSDSSDSNASSASDGSFTSASSEESEQCSPRTSVSAAPKGRREEDVNADDKRSKKDECLHESVRASENNNKNTRNQDGRRELSRSRLLPRKGIKPRASKPMLSQPSKLTGLKRSSVADIGKTNDVMNDEEQESRSTKRRRNVSQKANFATSDSRSYAEQLQAAGQDISGGGFPIRQDSSESDGKSSEL